MRKNNILKHSGKTQPLSRLPLTGETWVQSYFSPSLGTSMVKKSRRVVRERISSAYLRAYKASYATGRLALPTSLRETLMY